MLAKMAAAKRRILLLCYHFHPSRAVASRRVAAFAQTLGNHDCGVTVVSAFGDAALRRGAELAPGVRALPVPHPPRLLTPWLVSMKRLVTRREPAFEAAVGASLPPPSPPPGAGGPMRSLNERIMCTLNAIDDCKRWSLHAIDAALTDALEFPVDAVVASGPPFSGLIAAWRIARRLRVPLLADFRDPLASGTQGIVELSRTGLAVRRFFERRVVAYANAVTTASPGIAEALAGTCPQHAHKMQVVLNGFDGEPLPAAIRTQGRLHVLFAGSVYTNRDPFPFLTALEALLAGPGVDAARVGVTFVGNCESYRGQSLRAWLRGKRCAPVVRLLPEVSVEELRSHILDATVLLNLAQGQRGLIPAKTFEHLASGREILSICEADSDTGRLLDAIRGCMRVDPGDQPALEAALQDLYRRHAVEGVARVPSPDDVRRYSRDEQNQKFMRLVSSIA